MYKTAATNTFLFKFVDAITKNSMFEMESETNSGIKLVHSAINYGEDSAKQSREGIITVFERDKQQDSSFNEEVLALTSGDRVILPPLHWTEGVTYQNDTFWRANTKHIAAIVDDDKLKAVNGFVIVSKDEPELFNQQSSGLFVPVTGSDTDPSFVCVSSSADEVSVGDEIFVDVRELMPLRYNGDEYWLVHVNKILFTRGA